VVASTGPVDVGEPPFPNSVLTPEDGEFRAGREDRRQFHKVFSDPLASATADRDWNVYVSGQDAVPGVMLAVSCAFVHVRSHRWQPHAGQTTESTEPVRVIPHSFQLDGVPVAGQPKGDGLDGH
jgi:hypothetical protein